MTEEEKKAYALYLINRHNLDGVEFLSVFEMWPDYSDFDDSEISDEDARAVDDLISKAKIEVSW
jgi:hypothetical protein